MRESQRRTLDDLWPLLQNAEHELGLAQMLAQHPKRTANRSPVIAFTFMRAIDSAVGTYTTLIAEAIVVGLSPAWDEAFGRPLARKRGREFECEHAPLAHLLAIRDADVSHRLANYGNYAWPEIERDYGDVFGLFRQVIQTLRALLIELDESGRIAGYQRVELPSFRCNFSPEQLDALIDAGNAVAGVAGTPAGGPPTSGRP